MKGLADAQALLNRYEQEPVHVRQVARLAGQLFNGLRDWHRRDEEAAGWLQLGALLHDIGWSQTVDGSGHHKHSARLILGHKWTELEPLQVQLIAQVARYHRKSLPSEKHRPYQELSVQQQQLVCELGGILRVADALDRTHTQRIESVEARIKTGVIELTVMGCGSWVEERRAVLKKCDLLELASARKICFAQ